MSGPKKWIGEERRARILKLLKETAAPISGSELAAKTQVSRQAIVGDINLLKARKEPILATNQGYLYLSQSDSIQIFERTFVCRYLPDRVEKEFNIIVDHGVTLKELHFKHPVFGNIIASIMLSNRNEVKQFMDKITNQQGAFFPDGFHRVILSSKSEAALIEVERELEKAGLLVGKAV